MLIDDARSSAEGDVEAQADHVAEALAELEAEDIVAFDDKMTELRYRAYHNDLWAAAYIINGGCSDDGFEYFRCWLIAQGRGVYDDAIANADSLADASAAKLDIAEAEDMLYVGDRAYKAKTGDDLPPNHREYPELKGDEWTEDNVDQRCPRLAEMFG